jgi:hypothetical protein
MPNTKDNLAFIHFDKSPALPQAKSIRVSPFLETAFINFFFTIRTVRTFSYNTLFSRKSVDANICKASKDCTQYN